LLLIANISFSQDSLNEDLLPNREYGLDALFINRFLPLNNQIGFSSPYLFNYRRYTGNKYIRRNFNINLEGVLNRSDNEPNRSTLNIDLDLLFGWGKRKKVYKGFYLYSGADILVEPVITNTNTVDDIFINGMLTSEETKRNLYGLAGGVGPSFGVQYQFTDRIGLFTEAAFYFRLFYIYESFESVQNPLSDFVNQSLGFNRRFLLPGNLVVYYRI